MALPAELDGEGGAPSPAHQDTHLEDKFATDSDCANAARGYTDSKEEFLDCIEFRGMGRFSMGGLQLRPT